MLQKYLVESYWSDRTEFALRDRAARIEVAALELRDAGQLVTFLGSLFIPSDEVCFWRFASESLSGVEEASRQAGLSLDRIVQCIELTADETDNGS